MARIAHRTGSKERRGGAAVELAVALPFLGVMFAGAVDFCRVFAASQAVENAARSAALYASGTATNPNAADATDAAKQAAVAEASTLSPALAADDVTATFSGGMAVVTVTYDFPLLTPFLNSARKVTITRTVTMAMAP
jgi:Flp pilus assembly protein TadG